MSVRELSLFSGIGGGLLASLLLGHQIVGAVEQNAYCCRVLEQRQRDGALPTFPIFQTDIREFIRAGYADLYQGACDLVSAGFPCQPFSLANVRNRKGAGDERNLWPATLEVIQKVSPAWCFLENVRGLLSSGYFGQIVQDLAESGYDCRWRILSAADLGAPHRRERLWILAHSHGRRQQELGKTEWKPPEPDSLGWWSSEPPVGRMAYGYAGRVAELKALGNAQVPLVAATAWRLLREGGL